MKVLSWNVKEFGKKSKTKTPAAIRARVQKVAGHIKQKDPDIFGVLEAENVDIVELMEEEFPGFDFALTDGPRSNKEILVGWRQGHFTQVSFSQKRQFDLFNPYLRPGALLSVRQGNKWYSFLFLHTDSGTEARDFGNRFEMFDKIWNLRKALDKQVGAFRERLVVLGDLNTMGLLYPSKKKADERVAGTEEIQALDTFAQKNKMVVPVKSTDMTWRNKSGKQQSDLDHVVASSTVDFRSLGQRPDGTSFEIEVHGWNTLTKTESDKFYAELSDHSALVCDVKED